jgi:hypothetical protein
MRGKVFAHLFRMNATCPRCGYRFERENGYFLGAMVLSYAIASFSTVPTLALGILVAGLPIPVAAGIACAQVVLLTPWITAVSRLAWMHLDYRTDPGGTEESSQL